ncbi:MAG: phosphatase PAP2 family protein, partial [Oscillospiraceae bacterium]|nr:phosphatase PAP2 family protein [Oscillospiraceae bacterium]
YQSTADIKAKYLRERPFVEMGEPAWYAPDQNDATGSYASATTAAGWAACLVFAEMWPPMQDAILRLGFLFGEDRVISGSNYQSDVNAASAWTMPMIIAWRPVFFSWLRRNSLPMAKAIKPMATLEITSSCDTDS